jgi:[ribosomal protein S5]-alanine N-acetyltransferase
MLTASKYPIEQVLKKLPTLETTRLRLRRARLEDADQIYAYGQDPEIAQHIYSFPLTSMAHAIGYVKRLIRQNAEGEPAEWVMEHKISGRLIGTCGYTKFDQEDRRAEIGFILGAAWHRQGLMKEALREVLRFSFEDTNLRRIEARCVVANIASANLLEQMGFLQEGHFRNQIFLKQHFHDVVFYSILRSEYLRQRSLSSL